MATIANISIDVTKIDKSKLIDGKDGRKYYNMTFSINDSPDQYGNNIQVWEGQSKEERESKAQRNFLGNGRTVWTGESNRQNATVTQPIESNKNYTPENDQDDLPF